MGKAEEFRKLCNFLDLDKKVQSTLINEYSIETVVGLIIDLPSRDLENLRDKQVIDYLEYTRILGYQRYVANYGGSAMDLYQRKDNPEEIFIGFMYRYFQNIAMKDPRGEALERIYEVLKIDEQDRKMLAGLGVVIGTALARKLPSRLLKSLKDDSRISSDTFMKIIQFQVWCKQRLGGVSNAKFNIKVLSNFNEEVWADHARPRGGASGLGKGKPMKFSEKEVKRLPITVPITIGQLNRSKRYKEEMPPYLREGRMCCRIFLKCDIIKVVQESGATMILLVRDVDGEAVITTSKKTKIDQGAAYLIAKIKDGAPGLKCISVVGQVDLRDDAMFGPRIISSEINGCKLDSEVYGHALYAQYISLEYKLRTSVKEKVFQFVVGCTYINGKGGTVPVPVDAYAFIAMTNGVIGAEDILSGFASLVNEGLIMSLDDDGRYFQIKSDQFSKVANTKFKGNVSYSTIVSRPRKQATTFEGFSASTPKFHSGVD